MLNRAMVNHDLIRRFSAFLASASGDGKLPGHPSIPPAAVKTARLALSCFLRPFGQWSNGTAEAGVRNLEREIANLARKSVKEILMTEVRQLKITKRNLEKFSGVKKFRFGETEDSDLVGVTTGLAWTEVGGELLTIEASHIDGKGRVIKTGSLGDVMQESIQAALTLSLIHI